MTQLIKAKNNEITEQMNYIASKEDIDSNLLREHITKGWVVIPANKEHQNLKPIGIGKGLRIKVNANFGASPDRLNPETELEKLDVALKAGADTIMDLTIHPKPEYIDKIRRAVIKNSMVPVGTVPIYQAVVEAGGPGELSIEKYLEVFEKQAKDGVDFTTVHAGVTRDAFPLVNMRLMAVVSRGGSFLLNWMKKNNKESFLYEHFNEVLDIAKEYDVTISLGDGLRPGCIEDATDEAQILELRKLGKLASMCRDEGVQVMIEGPGHIPLDQIEENVWLEKEYCSNAPFYVLGPLPVDTAAGYDHIAGAIGGALAGMYGADFLCYLTPKEHIGLPDVEDVREGVIVTKIAAHAVDVARNNEEAVKQNRLMSIAREKRDWDEMLKYAIDQDRFKDLRRAECLKNPDLEKAKRCSMCGSYCALEIYKKEKKDEN